MIVTPKPEAHANLDKYDEYRLHMEKLLSASLVDFDIPARILIPLWDARIKRIGDLIRMSKDELLAVNRMGVVSVKYLETFLAHHKLALKKEPL